MDKRQKIERWETPVSDIKSLAMVCLVDDGNLAITVQDLRGPEDIRNVGRRRWRFTFEKVAAYRNILEEYCIPIERENTNEPNTSGNTIILENSEWIGELTSVPSFLLEFNPGIMHFIVCTEDDILEVLTSKWPDVEEIDPAAEDAPTPGKSHIYYVPEDRE